MTGINKTSKETWQELTGQVKKQDRIKTSKQTRQALTSKDMHDRI